MVDTRINFFYYFFFFFFFFVNLLFFFFFLFLLIVLSVHYCVQVECNSVYAYIHDLWRVNLCRSFLK